MSADEVPTVDPATATLIAGLTAQHAWLLDTGGSDRLHELYMPDGRLLGVAGDLNGQGAIRTWGLARKASTRRTWHSLSNLRLTSRGPDEVEATSGVTLHRHEGPGPGSPLPALVGIYRDVVVRADDGSWRFRTRSFESLFPAVAPAESRHTSGRPPTVHEIDKLPRELVEGAGLSRTALRSDQALVTLNWFQPGGERLPPHHHPFDQLSFVISGRLVFEVDGTELECGPGTALHIPADAPHTAWLVGEQVALNLDVFAPVRQDLERLAHHQKHGDQEPSRSTPTTAREG